MLEDRVAVLGKEVKGAEDKVAVLGKELKDVAEELKELKRAGECSVPTTQSLTLSHTRTH